MWTLLGIGSYGTTSVGIAELNRQAQKGILHTTLGLETITIPYEPEGKLSFVGGHWEPAYHDAGTIQAVLPGPQTGP